MQNLHGSDDEKQQAGAPKTLAEAIARAACTTPAGAGLSQIQNSVVDFMAQKFGAAYLMAESEEESARLESLWLQITQTNNGESK